MHHGVKGQKWGVRRYQNEDGTWKDAGNRHRRGDGFRALKSTKKAITNKNSEHSSKSANTDKFHLSEKQKSNIKKGAIIAGSVLAVYGAYKLNNTLKDRIAYNLFDSDEWRETLSSTAPMLDYKGRLTTVGKDTRRVAVDAYRSIAISKARETASNANHKLTMAGLTARNAITDLPTNAYRAKVNASAKAKDINNDLTMAGLKARNAIVDLPKNVDRAAVNASAKARDLQSKMQQRSVQRYNKALDKRVSNLKKAGKLNDDGKLVSDPKRYPNGDELRRMTKELRKEKLLKRVSKK